MVDFADRDGLIWMDGELRRWRDCQVHVLTHALHFATSVFEGERVYGGRVFRLTEHSERLRRSAALMSFPLPLDTQALNRATEEVVRANSIDDGYVRPIAWLGSEDIGLSGRGAAVHLAIAAWPWPSVFGREALERGIRLHTARWTRMAPTMLPIKSKTAAIYAAGALARREAEQAGFDDALLLDHQGFVAEGSSANVFLVEGARLITPIADSFLDGITRAAVIDLARGLGVEVAEERVTRARLREADEVFLTGTAYEVQPVSEIDGHSYRVGEISRKLIAAYQSLVRR